MPYLEMVTVNADDGFTQNDGDRHAVAGLIEMVQQSWQVKKPRAAASTPVQHWSHSVEAGNNIKNHSASSNVFVKHIFGIHFVAEDKSAGDCDLVRMVLLVQRITHDDTELFAAACKIRQQVFLEEYGLDPELDTEPSDAYPTTLHFLGFDSETQQHVAVARAVLVPETQSLQFGRIAVLPEARGRRHGLTLMQFAVKYVRAWDAAPSIHMMFLLCPQDKQAFYEKCGFTATHRTEIVRDLVLYEMTQSVSGDL